MPREADLSNVERAFILEALEQNVRLDSRRLDQFRNIDISFGNDYGSCTVQLGKTKVNTRISAEIGIPSEERKFDGIFTITTELSPLGSPAFEVGRQTEQEMILSRLLDKAIRRSNALDTESLCIVAGAKCWAIRADVHVLDHDGGLADASCMSVVAALQHFRRPDVSVEGKEVTIYPPAEREPVPLSLMHRPFCVTFSFYHAGETVVLDATLREEQAREGEMTVTINEHGELCQMAKLGGVPVDALALLDCTAIALAKVKDISALIAKRLREDSINRDAGGLTEELSAQNDR